MSRFPLSIRWIIQSTPNSSYPGSCYGLTLSHLQRWMWCTNKNHSISRYRARIATLNKPRRSPRPAHSTSQLPVSITPLLPILLPTLLPILHSQHSSRSRPIDGSNADRFSTETRYRGAGNEVRRLAASFPPFPRPWGRLKPLFLVSHF